MSEETNGEMADWERASAWACFVRFRYAVLDVRAAIRDHLWRNLCDPIPTLVGLAGITILLIWLSALCSGN